MQHKDFQQNETQYNINKRRHSALVMLNVNAYAERYVMLNVVRAECCVIFITMLSVRLNVVTLSLIMLSVPVPIKMLHL